MGTRTNGRLILLLTTVVSCQYQAPEAPPDLDKVRNDLDVFSQYEVQNDLKTMLPQLWDRANNAFLSAAAIDLNFIDNDLNLPQYGSLDPYGASTWPPRANIQEYATYAQARRNTSRSFGVFFVGHMTDNPIPSQNNPCPGFFYGVTSSNGVDNSVVSDVASRFTFMWLRDIQRETDGCQPHMPSGWSGFFAAVSMLTHELGHQRAGLTHRTVNQYHQGLYGSVPSQQDDVMSDQIPMADLGLHPYPAFDRKDQYPQAGDNTTCQGNLFKWRSINF